MKKITMLYLGLAITFVAFAKHRKHVKNTQAANNIISVMMQRTPCFGRCPDYTVEINRSGLATYTGIRFTQDSGAFTKNIGDKSKEIIALFDTYRVDTCKNRYPSRMQDLPGINFTIQYKDSTKHIVDAQFGPPYLKRLAATMDSAGKKTADEGWQKVKK